MLTDEARRVGVLEARNKGTHYRQIDMAIAAQKKVLKDKARLFLQDADVSRNLALVRAPLHFTYLVRRKLNRLDDTTSSSGHVGYLGESNLRRTLDLRCYSGFRYPRSGNPKEGEYHHRNM
jgi:hypothetical protein